MSHTTRRHEAMARRKRRGPKNRLGFDEKFDQPKAVFKPARQRRSNERTRLRREYL